MYFGCYKAAQYRQWYYDKPMHSAMVGQCHTAARHMSIQQPDNKKRHSNNYAQQTQHLHHHNNVGVYFFIIFAEQHRQRHTARKHTHDTAFEVFPRQLCRNNGQYHTCSQNNYRCFCYTYQLSQKVIPSVRGKGRTDTVACNHQCIFAPLLRPAHVTAMRQCFAKQSSQQTAQQKRYRQMHTYQQAAQAKRHDKKQ